MANIKIKVYGIDVLKSMYMKDYVLIFNYNDVEHPLLMIEQDEFEKLLIEYANINE